MLCTGVSRYRITLAAQLIIHANVGSNCRKSMKQQLFFCLFISLALISCGQKSIEPDKIIVHRIEYNGEQSELLKYSLIHYDSAQYKVFHYVDSSSSEDKVPIYRDLLIDTINPEIIIFCNDTFKRKGSNDFSVGQRHVLVNSFVGGFKGVDTGLLLYLNDQTGLFMVQSMGWGTMFTFVTDSLSERVTRLLIIDTTGFVLNKKFEEKFFDH
jgi:hypothetical protein